jgi:sugar (pentulose or hexulose) kinase
MADHDRRHLMRALFEGLAYESRRILESMEAGTAVPIHSVRTYGGASQNDVWNQIFSDILGRPITVTHDPPRCPWARYLLVMGLEFPADFSGREHGKNPQNYSPDRKLKVYDQLCRMCMSNHSGSAIGRWIFTSLPMGLITN